MKTFVMMIVHSAVIVTQDSRISQSISSRPSRLGSGVSERLLQIDLSALKANVMAITITTKIICLKHEHYNYLTKKWTQNRLLEYMAITNLFRIKVVKHNKNMHKVMASKAIHTKHMVIKHLQTILAIKNNFPSHGFNTTIKTIQ